MTSNSRPVYSTEAGRLCPECRQPKSQCRCRQARKSEIKPTSGITIWLERKGRAGKVVTVIRDLPLNQMELQLLGSSLKKHCGSGGTVQDTVIEIQGDHREAIRRYLLEQGFQAKLAGG